MKIAVDRHGSPTPEDVNFCREFGDDVSRLIDSLEQSPEAIDVAFSMAVVHLQACCWIDEEAASLETWESMVTAMQLGSALFALSGASGSRDYLIGDNTVSLRPAESPNGVDVPNWLTAFFLAIVCRDNARAHALCEIPIDLLRASNVRVDEFMYLWVEVIQTVWTGRKGLEEKLGATLDASYPEVVTVAPRELLQTILYPPINLLNSLYYESSSQFNDSLAESLSLHQLYWCSDLSRIKDKAGSVALPLLAIACIARDSGIPVNVESDYMPKYLLNAAWVGEFET